jgi:hypothetical protein
MARRSEFRVWMLLGLSTAALIFAYAFTQSRLVQSRNAYIARNGNVFNPDVFGKPNLIRRLFGDHKYSQVVLDYDATKEERDKVHALFPESMIDRPNRDPEWRFGENGEPAINAPFPDDPRYSMGFYWKKYPMKPAAKKP